jgi:hypothetical protein
MQRILIDTIHLDAPNGGGRRRSTQLCELARRAGCEPSVVSLAASGARRGRVTAALAFAARKGMPLQPTLKAARNFGGAIQCYTEALLKHQGCKVILRERTSGVGQALSWLAREFGYRSFALPENIESLVPDQYDDIAFPAAGLGALRNELRQFRLDHAVSCISREEQWLLNVSGIDAGFLPYYPIPPWEEELLELRRTRRPSRNRFLLLGSAGNPPVRQGMLELLRLASPIAGRCGAEIHVAGNETEQFAAHDLGPGVILHGTVTSAALSDLMRNCCAALVYQRQGCGALTKVPEFLIAGIPVIGNANALRSAHHLDGVYEFSRVEELESLVQADLPAPATPPRPAAEEARFIHTLRSLASQ